ncbi:MAG: NAD-binding protein [Thermoanaerobaculia bacterium]|nr:NAD-binding protein [Thermoanaerobaculia bacterium]
MKFLSSQLTYLLTEKETRRNLKALLKYLLFLTLVIVVYSIAFHVIMDRVEDRDFSWVTGVYWTLTVMSTLGFGDITFTSDIGRLFSLLVLLSGIVLLLIVLPFAFIRFFYAPWLEAQIRLRAPREVPSGTSDHVVIIGYDDIARGLLRKLTPLGVPCFVLERDPALASELHGDGVPVVAGEIDSVATYSSLEVERARAVLTNLDDATNTNVTLTVRETAGDVPVYSLVEEDDSVDLLELAGADHVIPLKRRLGEQLANRVGAGHAQSQLVGRFENLLIAEFPVHKTPLAGRTIRETKLRQVLGINVVAVWERGRLLPAHADLELTDSSVPVVVGTQEQMLELDTLLVIYDVNLNPVLVLGGGKVGTAAARALRDKGMAVHLVEKDPVVAARIEAELPGCVFVGDAADREVLLEAGLDKAPSVILTTNNDATNIYLAVYCRRLQPGLRIVSRINHERNIEAIHRAGADLALSYAHLGVETVFSLLRGQELVLLGEGLEFLTLDLPEALAGRSLAECDLGRRTGLNVVGVETADGIVVNPGADLSLPTGSKLLAIGTGEQRRKFRELFAPTDSLRALFTPRSDST